MQIVFFVDTSISMNQRMPGQGLTLLDVAKSGVEHFLKVRRERLDGKGDRYWLATTDQGPAALKHWPKDSATNVRDITKCLVGHSFTPLGPSLRTIFEALNLPRLLHPDPTGLDHYGYGWHPGSVEPAAVLLFTDGGLPTSDRGVADSLVIPPLGRAESELVEQPFHWDQRLFSFEIRPPPSPSDPTAPAELLLPRLGLREQCQATGGEAHVALSLKHLQGLLEQAAARLTGGVVLSLTVEVPTTHEDGTLANRLYQKPVLIVPEPGAGPPLWPLPEDYHVDRTTARLPPRRPHPNVVLRRSRDFDGEVPPGLRGDRYVLEPGPVAETLAKRFRSEVWKAYVRSREAPEGHEEPFGFVRVDPQGPADRVSFVVLPYNYPQLLTLLSAHTPLPNKRWLLDFEAYMRDRKSVV